MAGVRLLERRMAIALAAKRRAILSSFADRRALVAAPGRGTGTAPAPSPGGALFERIDDRKIAEAAAVLKILAIEPRAAGFERGGDDQRVVEGEPMIACEGDSVGVGRKRQRRNVGKSIEDDGERVLNIAPGSLMLPPHDIDELIQHLRADRAAVGEGGAGGVLLRYVEKGVDEDVGVEKTRHRSFASPRSNLYPSGAGQLNSRNRSRNSLRLSILRSPSLRRPSATRSTSSPALRPMSLAKALGTRTARLAPHLETCIAPLKLRMISYLSKDIIASQARYGVTTYETPTEGGFSHCLHGQDSASPANGSGR